MGLPPLTGKLLSTPEIEFLSWSPRSWLYHNFLTPEECDHIINLVRTARRQVCRLRWSRQEAGSSCARSAQAASLWLAPAHPRRLPAQATPAMERSAVVDSVSGGSMASECALPPSQPISHPPLHPLPTPYPPPCRIRTSSGAFLTRGQDEVVSAIEQRIAAFSMVPVGARPYASPPAVPPASLRCPLPPAAAAL